MTYELKVCKNETCTNPVPPSKGAVERLYCSMRCANLAAGREYRRRRAAEERVARQEISKSETRICANTTCSNVVEPNLRGGRQRIYCSYRCGQQMSSRRYYERVSGHGSGSGMLATDDSGRPYVKRSKAVTVQAAESRFKKHSSGPGCPNSTEPSGRCPGRWDPYDRNHACLIRAVLREDWDQMRRKADGREWERELTTEAGYWKQPQPQTV